MLKFSSVRWKNLLSTGSQFTEIILDQHRSTLVTGPNGSGKSTMLDALCFGLFGRPFRSVSKGQLINSINTKDCVVEVQFSVNGHSYKVVRGIKPAIFDIYCDDVLINQDAALKDYQKVLEQQILKLNFKTFTHVVILGSATFVPFMQLPSTQRREVTEDILDIKIFSIMNAMLRDKSTMTKDQIAAIDSAINSHRTKIQSQKKLIDVLVTSKKEIIDKLKQKMLSNGDQLADAQSKIDQINAEVAQLQQEYAKHDDLVLNVKKANNMRAKYKIIVSDCGDSKQFFHSHEVCPSCSQQIDDSHKDVLLCEIESKIEVSSTKLAELESILAKMEAMVESNTQLMDQVRSKTIHMSALNNTVMLLNQQNGDIQKEISNTVEDSGNIDEEKQKLRDMASVAIDQVAKKTDLLDQRSLQEVATLLLKDGGVKTAIIREYLPVMNKLINRHLQIMDFYVKFELDEAFNETIKSRNRDAFTYDSFSEGEKQKINLGIIFMWRQIAKMKNSVNTNLLIMDEVGDSSLDVDGVKAMFSILQDSLPQSNFLVISHREVERQETKFDRVIQLKKIGDFSVMSETVVD